MSAPDTDPAAELPSIIAKGLAELEQGLPQADEAFLRDSKEKLTSWISALTGYEGLPAEAKQSLGAALWTGMGHVERESGLLEEAVAAYDKALGTLGEVRDARAGNLWIVRGLSQLSGPSPEHWRAAVASFDRAIALRESDGGQDFPLRWGLAAAWMNRGEALEKLGGEENLREMLGSNARAAELLTEADFDKGPVVRTRLALIWMNQGRALAVLTERFGAGEGEASLAAYARAADILRPGVEQGAVEPRRMLAVVLANLSRARLTLSPVGTPEGEREALEALSIVIADEESDPWGAELGLVLRVTLCRTLATLPGEIRHEEITDLAEEGLGKGGQAWARWQGPPSLPVVIGELFRCGALAYQRHQPQFFAEFLLDHLDPERARSPVFLMVPCHEAAEELLRRSIGQFQQSGFAGLGTEGFAKNLDLFEEWQQCRRRLAEIREALQS